MKTIIPENEKGKAVDLAHTFTANTIDEAKQLFKRACERLSYPGTWHEMVGTLGATFTVKDANKNTLQRPLAKNDFIQIDLPAPGTDWVQVDAINRNANKNSDESFAITVKVSREPGSDKEAVDHFFDEGASSTFMLRRKGMEVIASYHGRNETPNKDNLRNTIVALGAMSGLSELQWTALLKGLLE